MNDRENRHILPRHSQDRHRHHPRHRPECRHRRHRRPLRWSGRHRRDPPEHHSNHLELYKYARPYSVRHIIQSMIYRSA